MKTYNYIIFYDLYSIELSQINSIIFLKYHPLLSINYPTEFHYFLNIIVY
jgi:hypothetical protein